jgi:hypothetical protein
MKKLLFLISAAAMPSAIVSMQNPNDQEAAKKLLLDSYAFHVRSKFQPTTQAFMEKNPTASESLILQRYVQEVANTAMSYRKKDLPMNKIGEEFRAALDYTPCDPLRLDWILTGKEIKGGMCCAMICSGEWQKKQKEIEAQIAKK